jgi:tetratricopeptide (TPR) repeat protein
LAALYEAEPDEIAMQLAHHFLDAGEPERAVTHLRRAGDRARRLAALDEAAHFYSEALEYWPEADGSGRAELLRQLGECQSVIGDTDEALESFEASFSLFETLGDRQGAGAVQRLIGGVKWEKARWEEAHGHYLQSLAILERIPESVELAWTVSAISRMHMLGTEFDQAIAWGERALELAERFNAHDVTVNTLNSVGVSYFALGQSERGLSMLQDSLDRALALGLPYDISRARVNMFPLLLSSFRHGEARLLSDEGLAYTERHHMRLAVGFNRKISAELDWRTGQWARAASHIHALLAVTKDFRSSDIVSVFSSVVLGGMYIEFGQPYAAREVLEGLRPTARRAMQPQTSGLYFAALARAYAILGLDAETRQALEEFFDMFDQSANAELTSTNHLLFACQWLATRLDREALDQAQACLRRLERVDAQTRSPESAVCLSEARGSVALAMSDLHRAVEQLQEAAGRWDAAGRPYDHARALNHLGQALVQGGNVAAARATFEQALAIVDRLAAQLSEEELKASFLSSVLVQDIQAGVTAGD